MRKKLHCSLKAPLFSKNTFAAQCHTDALLTHCLVRLPSPSIGCEDLLSSKLAVAVGWFPPERRLNPSWPALPARGGRFGTRKLARMSANTVLQLACCFPAMSAFFRQLPPLFRQCPPLLWQFPALFVRCNFMSNWPQIALPECSAADVLTQFVEKVDFPQSC